MAAGRRPSIMGSGRADPILPVDCLRLTGRSDPCPFHFCLTVCLTAAAPNAPVSARAPVPHASPAFRQTMGILLNPP